ncbi:unnamed protein product [Psylliodes chrysocephalus]|uniref:Uncharacterized protein n=1 Tax=Psylliodes chrysocephalus TaxID=3402493 RepID=A0A9P0CUA9_9CUCU|nr:unnamed protein product [Psylliodes chrysocephala]
MVCNCENKIQLGASLECYTCNTTFVTERSDDACKGLETLTKCTDPAVCLSAVLLYEDGGAKSYKAIKSCNINQAGQECEYFLKNMQTTSPTSKISLYNNKCSTCEKEKCNQYNKATAALIPTFVVFIISFVLCKLI